jgi:hypothetical protein
MASSYILELSDAAYDEIEGLLLEAGFDFRFLRGPGSAIDLGGFFATRGPMPIVFAEAERRKRQYPVSEAELTKPTHPDTGEVYCFQCDEMVTKPCDRAHCLQLKAMLTPASG